GGRMLNRDARSAVQELPVPPEPEAGEPIVLPVFERPYVSLVVPVYSGAELTRRCLQSIRDNTDRVAYEVIVVDDCADSACKRLLDVVEGARVLHNEQNRGYASSVLAGADIARGEWLVLCNNDIEVHEGWLPAMLQCAESCDRVGVVAPKFV